MDLLRLNFAPAAILTGGILFAAVMALAAIWVALAQPAIDLPEGVGTRDIVAVGDMVLTEEDRIDEPDFLPSYEAVNRLYDRQTILTGLLRQAPVELTIDSAAQASGTITVAPAARGLSDLPFAFWYQLIVGFLALSISAWVLSLRPHDFRAQMFALTGLAIPVFAMSAGIYSTRDLAMDGTTFRVLSSLNHIGALGFGCALVALLAAYPKLLVPKRWLLIIPLIYVPVAIGDVTQLLAKDAISFGVISQMLAAIVLGVVQWRRSRGDPLERAGLRWFTLSCLVGCSLFIGLIIVPMVLGLFPPLPQGYAFGFFLIMHCGLALGLVRYRLFGVDEWAYRIWTWSAGAALVVMLDLLLIALFNTAPWVSFSIALLIAGWIYFPLRQWLWERFFARREGRVEESLPAVIRVGFAPTKEEGNRQWDQLLDKIFRPLAHEEAAGQTDEKSRIEDEGLALFVPAAGGYGARRLRYADQGRRLFARRDGLAADSLCRMMNLAAESRNAYEKGVAEERGRISRDMHDNIGAQLLSALHSKDRERKDALLRETIADLRGIIFDTPAAGTPVDDLLADLRHETAERLAASDIALEWKTEISSAVAPVLEPRRSHALRSLVREAVSNIVKHAGAGRVTITIAIDGEMFSVTIADDGIGFDRADVRRGNGLGNLETRAAALDGRLEWPAGEASGAHLRLVFPLEPATVA